MSNFLKRKAKEAKTLVEEIVSSPDLVQEETPIMEEYEKNPILDVLAPLSVKIGYDIYSLDGGGSYSVAEIQYNPETGEAKVLETFEISRLIALSYYNQKTALGILKKQKKSK